MKRRDYAGAALIAAVLCAFAALLAGAAYVDHQRGISVDQSLRSVGL